MANQKSAVQKVAAQRVALLSNVNMNYVIRMLEKEISVYRAEGYGNELGILMNPESAYHGFSPDITFLIMDLAEIIGHQMEASAAEEMVEKWFAGLGAAISSNVIYYISDAYLWCPELDAIYDCGRKQVLEQIWQKHLKSFMQNHRNVRIFPYRRMIERLGEENAFSRKMWYMGKILLSSEAQKRLCDLILEKTKLENRTPKKVLAVDLDNTLWGGLAGEADHTPILLSEDHSGLAYKNLQRVILQMQREGVLLVIVSKNNEEDVEKLLQEHPHMVLRPACFAAKRVNWKPKHENLKELAEELNLGLDSFVFWDDNPAERKLVAEMLPQVAVPDFPEKAEELSEAMTDIYKRYFAKPFVTAEDKEKTNQYAANAKRSKMLEHAGSFDDYLKQLQIVMKQVAPGEHMERLLQLLNKTNQFNLTTHRYTEQQLQSVMANQNKHIYLYQVEDCFGDNGIVAAAVVDTAGEAPVIEDFVMSCRIMGRNIEYAVIEDIEAHMLALGFDRLRGYFIPTAKNKPVEGLYERLGYQKLPVEGMYETALPTDAKRVYYVERRREA